MKKENRKLAQELRAAERKKKAFLRRLKRILTVVIPLLAVLILVSVIVWDSVSSKEEETASNSAAEEQTSGTDVTADSASDMEGTASYSTDASLAVQNGDTVNIDYVGTVDGVEFDGGSTNDVGTDLTIGSGLYIDDFEEQLIGSHPGDTVEVNVTFPEDYNAADLAGKDAVFEVIINGIYQ